MKGCAVHSRRFRDLADAFDVLVFPEVIPPEDDEDPPINVTSDKWLSFLR